MLRDVTCSGSLTFPPEVGNPDAGSSCPACGAPVVLGYGGLIPAHPVTDDQNRLLLATGPTCRKNA